MWTVRNLLLLLGAVVSLGVASAQLSFEVEPSQSFDLTTRFLETIHHERPDAFYPFLRSLQQYQVRPKVTFSDPAFASSVSIDGTTRPSRYANHNPVFTRLAKPFEAFQALEASFARARLWTERGAALVWRTALANDVAVPTLREMDAVARDRDAQLGGGRPKTCPSWIDVAGERACTGDEFWKLVGVQQMFLREPVKVTGSSPELHSFDRLLPSHRNESLPLVVLYSTATDEAFPALFDVLHRLAQPAAGYPRIQFALRWKLDDAARASFSPGRYDPDRIEELIQVRGLDLSSRAVAYITQADDKIDALSRVASSLPLLSSQLASISVPTVISSVRDSVQDTNTVTLNGVKISGSHGIAARDLVSAMRTDTRLLSKLSSMPRSNEQLARNILLNASVALEAPKQTSHGPAVPTLARPLEFVNLVDAGKGIAPLVTRASYIEGVTDEDLEIDPPALASIFLIADLESSIGRKQVEQTLDFLDSAAQVRVAFLHRPSENADTASDSPYSFPSLLYSLAASKRLTEVYPSELRAFLDLEVGPDGPKRSLDDTWTQENPITPFLDGGLKEEELEGATKHRENVSKFVSRLGLGVGESAVMVNGRIVRIDDTVMTSASLHNLVQYELKRRIRPVVAAALPAMSPALAEDRVMQAEVFNLATSVLASSGVDRQARLVLPSPLPTLRTGNVSVVPMFSLSAVVDPVSSFARRVIPILVELSRDPLFTLDLALAPTSSVPNLDDSASLFGSAFATTLAFDEDASLDEVPRAVKFSAADRAFVAGHALDVSLEIDGSSELVRQRVTVDSESDVVVLATEGRGDPKSRHARDEL
ncbi:hypothetical protein JCM11491_005377 [Sporobolomyces phaffii]